MRKHLPAGVTAFGTILVLLIFGTGVAAFWTRDQPPLPQLKNNTDILFGLTRSAHTRTAVIDVCGFTGVPEPCPTGTAGTSPDTVSGTAPASRPAIRSASLTADLDGQTCQRIAAAGQATSDRLDETIATRAQFPAAQVKVSAELVGQTGLSLTFTADPKKPEVVGPGVYCGTVVVERDKGGYIVHGIRIVLGDRGAGLPLITAILFLVLGSLIGIAVRLGNDPIAALMPVRRRERSLQRRVAAFEAARQHAEAVQTLKFGLDDVDDAIAMMDVADAKTRLDTLEQFLASSIDKPDQAAADVAKNKMMASRRAPVAPLTGTRTVPWVIDRYWVFSSALIVIVVTVSGLQTQYLDAIDVVDDIGSWVALGIFGLAFQITASTVAEAVGKLQPGGG